MYIHSEEYDDYDCPLCMEELDIADKNFKPCPCGYKICRFCWHHIRENLNGLCPACRREYSEKIAEFEPISTDEIARIKREKKEKERQQRDMDLANRRHLANMRVVQKNLIYVIGLHPKLATEEIVRSQDYFGHFGKIAKIVINKRQTAPTSNANGTTTLQASAAVYITYVRKEDATKALHAVDGSVVAGRILKASYGTTKYCTFYLRNMACPNPICLYLHQPGEDADTMSKEEFLTVKHRDQMHSHQYSDSEKRLSSSAQQSVSNNRSSNVVPNTHSFQYHHEHQQRSPTTTTTTTGSRTNSFSSSDFSPWTQQQPSSSCSPTTQHNSGANGNNNSSALPTTASWGSGSPLMVKKLSTDGCGADAIYITSDTFGPPLSVAVATQQQQSSVAVQQKPSKRKSEKKKRKDQQKLSQKDKEQFEKELRQTKHLTATLMKKQQQYCPQFPGLSYDLFRASTTGIARFVLGDASKQIYSTTTSPTLTADNLGDDEEDDIELDIDIDRLFDYCSRDYYYDEMATGSTAKDSSGQPVGVKALYEESDYPLSPTEEIKKEPRLLDQTSIATDATEKNEPSPILQLSLLDYLTKAYPAAIIHSDSFNPFANQWKTASSDSRGMTSAFAQTSHFSTLGSEALTTNTSNNGINGHSMLMNSFFISKHLPSIFNTTPSNSVSTIATIQATFSNIAASPELPLTPIPSLCERKTSRFGFAQF